MSQSDPYTVCKKLDEQKRYFGLTLDEFIPIVFIVVLCFWCGSVLTGFLLAGVVWLVLRHFKKGQGTSWLMNLCYWYLSGWLCRGVFFIKTPSALKRHWLR